MGAGGPAGVTPRARAAAARLRIDSAAAEVLRAFDTAGVQSILLKGASKRQWLEDDPLEGRSYTDCDLLVRPQGADAAARALTELGFTAEFDAEKMPAWWREHALAWKRDVDGAIIDLHRTLPGVGVDDERAWAVLSAGAEMLLVGGYPASVPAIPARAMHLAIHAAHHGPAWRLELQDLSRAIDCTGEQTWLEASEIARRLDATGAFVAGLRLVPAGQALIEQLGIVPAPRVDVQLLAGNPSALSLERFVRADDLRTRLSMIHHKLFPPPTFLRHWSPLAGGGRLGLLIAYAWRPVWVMMRMPAAVREWLKARKLSGG